MTNRIKITGKMSPRIRHTGRVEPLVDPQMVVDALGGETVRDEKVYAFYRSFIKPFDAPVTP
jgi:hypothetical protein